MHVLRHVSGEGSPSTGSKVLLTPQSEWFMIGYETGVGIISNSTPYSQYGFRLSCHRSRPIVRAPTLRFRAEGCYSPPLPREVGEIGIAGLALRCVDPTSIPRLYATYLIVQQFNLLVECPGRLKVNLWEYIGIYRDQSRPNRFKVAYSTTRSSSEEKAMFLTVMPEMIAKGPVGSNLKRFSCCKSWLARRS